MQLREVAARLVRDVAADAAVGERRARDDELRVLELQHDGLGLRSADEARGGARPEPSGEEEGCVEGLGLHGEAPYHGW